MNPYEALEDDKLDEYGDYNQRLLSTSWSLLLTIESQSSVPGYTIESHTTPLLVILQSLSISQ